MSYTFVNSANNVLSSTNTVVYNAGSNPGGYYPTAGNLLVLYMHTSTGSGPGATGVSDNGTGGSGWVIPVSGVTPGSGGYYNSIAYCLSAASGITTITVTTLGGEVAIKVVEFSVPGGWIGQTVTLATTPYFTRQVAPGTTADAITSNTAGNISLPGAPALLIGITGTWNENGGVTAGTGFTLCTGPDNVGCYLEHAEAVSTGTKIATFTSAVHGAADEYQTSIVAFSEPATGVSIAWIRA